MHHGGGVVTQQEAQHTIGALIEAVLGCNALGLGFGQVGGALGQGLNLGLRDVAALAEILVDARRLGLDSDLGPDNDSVWEVTLRGDVMEWRGVGSDYARRFRITSRRVR